MSLSTLKSYRIMCQNGNKVLNIYGNNVVGNNINVCLYTSDFSDGQRWKISTILGSGTCKIVSAIDQSYGLDCYRGQSKFNNCDIYKWSSTADDADMLIKLVPVSEEENIYKIYLYRGGEMALCLTAVDNNNGSSAGTSTSTGNVYWDEPDSSRTNNQTWKFVECPEPTGDERVFQAQMWLNENYGQFEGFNPVPDDDLGATGWSTMFAFIRALQIELGLRGSQLADNFGETTTSLFKSHYGTITQGTEGNIAYIIQGGLYAKGYDPGGFSGYYGSQTAAAIMDMQDDAGLAVVDGKVDAAIMKAILTLNAFVLVNGGDATVRTIQRNLNHSYQDYIGIMPCDGIYGRDTNKALIYALQKEENTRKTSV